MILLHDIYLENFMSVKSLSMKFERDSIVAISGVNGAGKSTLLYAIACAMMNYRREYGGKFKTFVKAEAKTARIVLNVTIDGGLAHYDVVLPSSDSGSVQRTVTYKDKTYVNSEYNQFMEEHDLAQIQNLMFIFQGQQSIVAATPGERASMLKKVFQFEFNDIVADLKSEQTKSKELVMQNEAVINELKNKEFHRLAMLRVPPQSILDNWKSQLSELEVNLSQIGDIDSNSITLCENSRKRTLMSMESTNSKITESQNRMDADNVRLEDMKSRLLSDEDKAYIESRMHFESDGIKGFRERLEEQQSELYELRSQLRVKTHDLTELDNQIAIASGGVCHACGQHIGESHREKLHARRAILSNEIDALNDKISSIDTDDTQRKLASSIASHDDYETQLASNEKLIASIGDVEKSIEASRQLYETNKEYLTSITENLKHYDEELVRLEALKPLIEQRDSLEARKADLSAKLKEADEIIMKNLMTQQANIKLEQDEKERDERVAKLMDDNNRIALDMDRRKQSISIFETQFPNYITLQACKKIEDYINEIVQKLFPYMKVSMRQYQGGVNFYYTSEDSPQELPVCMASGAQAKILSLAYSFAIANLYGLSCLLMDEVDSDMTAENSAMVFKFLASVDDFEQIVFISHKPESREAIKESNRENISFYEVEHGNYTLVEG